jgi:hypothetical protein
MLPDFIIQQIKQRKEEAQQESLYVEDFPFVMPTDEDSVKNDEDEPGLLIIEIF